MFQVEVKWDVAEFGPVFREGVADLAKVMQQKSREDVRSGIRGRFYRGLSCLVDKIEGGYRISETLRPAFAKVWEYGGISRGRPLLWIPIPPNKTRVRKYGGKLVRPGGRRVLMSVPSRVKITGVYGSGERKPQPMYAGVTSVTHRQHFHLRDIAIAEANNFIEHMGAFKT